MSGVERSHGSRGTGTVQPTERSAHQLLQGQSAAYLGRSAAGVHTATGWHVPQGSRG